MAPEEDAGNDAGNQNSRDGEISVPEIYRCRCPAALNIKRTLPDRGGDHGLWYLDLRLILLLDEVGDSGVAAHAMLPS